MATRQLIDRERGAAVAALLSFYRRQERRMLTLAEEAAVRGMPLSVVQRQLAVIEAEMAQGGAMWAAQTVPRAYDLGRQYTSAQMERLGIGGAVDPRYGRLHELSRTQTVQRVTDDLAHAVASARRRVEGALSDIERRRFTGVLLEEAGAPGAALSVGTIREQIKGTAGVTVVGKSGKARTYGLLTYTGLVAESNLIGANTEGQVSTILERTPDDGSPYRLARISPEIGAHTCDLCARLAGRVVNLAGKGFGEILGIDDLPDGSPPPWHPNCVHDLTPLSAEEARAFIDSR